MSDTGKSENNIEISKKPYIPKKFVPTKEVLSLAVAIGQEMLRNGAEIYRVEDSMMYILEEFGIEQCNVYVLSNGIFASVNEDSEDGCSMVRHVPLGSVHLGRIAALNQLTRDICRERCNMEEAWKQLEKCRTIPVYSPLTITLAAGLGSGGFCYLFGGNAFDALIAFIVGILEQQLLFLFQKQHMSRIIMTILASSFVSLSCSALALAGMTADWNMVIIGGAMLLVPGIAFTTAIRDFYNGDYLSGIIHLIDALITAICVALGSCMPLIIQEIGRLMPQ